MSGSDLVLFEDNVTVPPPLSLRLRARPFNNIGNHRNQNFPDPPRRVIVDGPPGAIELQIRPDMLGEMSIEYHSRQPMPSGENPMPDCEVLDGATCYPDGMNLGVESEFKRWLQARDGQAIVNELVRRHQATTWTLDERPDTPLVPDAQYEASQPPGEEASS